MIGLPTRVLNLCNQSKLIRGRTRNSGKALLGPLFQQRGVRTSNVFPCSVPKGGGRAGSLCGVRVGVYPEVRLEGWRRWSAPPFGGVESRGHVQDPAFAPNTLLLLPALPKWPLGFWSFCILSIICPNCACTQLFLVPYGFFVFCCLRRCLFGCKHCSKGSQIPGPSLSQ